jgi:hypothetical protein
MLDKENAKENAKGVSRQIPDICNHGKHGKHRIHRIHRIH